MEGLLPAADTRGDERSGTLGIGRADGSVPYRGGTEFSIHKLILPPPRWGEMVLQNSSKEQKKNAGSSLSEPWRFPREGWV